MRAAIALAGVLALASPAVSAPRPGPIVVRDATIRPAAPGQPMTAAYMTLVSGADRPLRLTAVRCACAGSVTVHESTLTDGVMRMRPVDSVVVPPHGSVRFQPGGLHLMVMDLKRPIKPGDATPMQLSFDHAPTLAVRFKAGG